MTEADWWTCQDPQEMLACLQGRASRKFRCFAFACGRRYCVIWKEAAARDDHYRRVKSAIDALCGRTIAAAERLDDGQGTAETVEALRRQLWEGSGAPIGLNWDMTATIKGDAIHWVRRYEDDCLSASEQASRDATEVWGRYNERLFQAHLLRDLLGSPFRPPPALPPSLLVWGDGLISRLAQSAYEERLPGGLLDPVKLGVMADALEDAGCDNADLIAHLRNPGPHWRGCFALDTILSQDR